MTYFTVFSLFIMHKWTPSCQSSHNDCNNYGMKPQSHKPVTTTTTFYYLKHCEKLFLHSSFMHTGVTAKKNQRSRGLLLQSTYTQNVEKALHMGVLSSQATTTGTGHHLQLSILKNTTWQLTISFLFISSLANSIKKNKIEICWRFNQISSSAGTCQRNPF